MKKYLIISLLLSGGILMSQELDDPIWSKPVNGLQARIIFKYNENMIFNDTPVITAYLELQNVSDIANPLKIKWSNGDNIHFNLIDDEGRGVPPSSGLPYNELSPILEELILPHGSTLKFIISHHGAGVPKSEKVVIDFGSSYVWVIKQGD
ncbi:MAG: hypothetical protein GY707_15475, partial [Desulfobacteraceae bacterium]|nr:hypothetical protein [Desulfobacteraceae bacterium]